MKNKPIFIIGAERSGTTLLRIILASHSNICIPPESKFMLRLYPEYREMKNRDDVKRFIDDLGSDHFFKMWKLDIDLIKKGLFEIDEINYKNIVCKIYRLYAENEHKEIWGDKNPGYTLEVKNILEIFPCSKFIHIIRDGRDCVVSLRETEWGEKNIKVAAKKWVKFVQAGNDAKENYPDKILEIKYEDLVKYSNNTINDICTFLSLSYEPEMLDFYRNNKKKVLVPLEHQAFHKNTLKPIMDSRVGRWRYLLSKKETRIVQKIQKIFLKANGYCY